MTPKVLRIHCPLCNTVTTIRSRQDVRSYQCPGCQRLLFAHDEEKPKRSLVQESVRGKHDA